MKRRRFLMLSAAALLPFRAEAMPLHTWQGAAFGSGASLTLTGASKAQARRVFRRVENTLLQIEGQFSLHRDSALSRLNRDGHLAHPGGDILALFALSSRVHTATAGAFDPSVQPLWLATATGGDTIAARTLINWPRIVVTETEIRLPKGMALTFNGIAQGYAADRVSAILRDEGFGDVLIDMGEISAMGQHPDHRDWQAAIALPDGQEVARINLRDRALATSSPKGTLIGRGLGHILDPKGAAPRWQLASVSAPSAALADALSTAFCVMDRATIDHALAAFPEAKIEMLI